MNVRRILGISGGKDSDVFHFGDPLATLRRSFDISTLFILPKRILPSSTLLLGLSDKPTAYHFVPSL